MANGHGGYRRPANPAPVSGPGALSRRTDGNQPVMPTSGLPYGENQALDAIQSAARMPQMGGGGMPAIVPLDAPSEFPREPITAGAAFGPGPGPSPTSGMPVQKLRDTLARLMPNDLSGQLEELYLHAERYGI
jgi:hypothetical protein